VKPHPHRDLTLINAAGFLRSLGVGLMGVVVGIYLFRVGLATGFWMLSLCCDENVIVLCSEPVKTGQNKS
jgi:hypothetical protein